MNKFNCKILLSCILGVSLLASNIGIANTDSAKAPKTISKNYTGTTQSDSKNSGVATQSTLVKYKKAHVATIVVGGATKNGQLKNNSYAVSTKNGALTQLSYKYKGKTYTNATFVSQKPAPDPKKVQVTYKVMTSDGPTYISINIGRDQLMNAPANLRGK